MYGICQLSIVPMRKLPSDSSEQISQLIFGEQVTIEEKNDNWYAVKSLHDNYRGWVDKKQLHIYINIEKADYTVNCTFIRVKDTYLPIGSYLRKSDLINQNIDQLLQSNSIIPLEKSNDTLQLINNSKKFLNAPYLWGGRTPFGIDCSGLTQMVYRLNGISLNRDAYQQAEMGTLVPSQEKLKTGDLAFFNKGVGDKITHVGIVNKEYNELQIIHASGWVQINQLNIDGIVDSNGSLSHHYLFSKRIID